MTEIETPAAVREIARAGYPSGVPSRVRDRIEPPTPADPRYPYRFRPTEPRTDPGVRVRNFPSDPGPIPFPIPSAVPYAVRYAVAVVRRSARPAETYAVAYARVRRSARRSGR